MYNIYGRCLERDVPTVREILAGAKKEFLSIVK
jgi:hypothetical protein